MITLIKILLFNYSSHINKNNYIKIIPKENILFFYKSNYYNYSNYFILF